KEALKDKATLDNFWHDRERVMTNLPGSSWIGLTYDDFRKYAEMAKFLREKVGEDALDQRFSKTTLSDFFKEHGLGKK
ncbi:MAG: hypothetical protein AAB724_02760, partial [Patescibacteria group bacterium]